MNGLEGIIEEFEFITLVDRKKRIAAIKDPQIEYEFVCDLKTCSATAEVILDNIELLAELFGHFNREERQEDYEIVVGVIKSNLDKSIFSTSLKVLSFSARINSI